MSSKRKHNIFNLIEHPDNAFLRFVIEQRDVFCLIKRYLEISDLFCLYYTCKQLYNLFKNPFYKKLEDILIDCWGFGYYKQSKWIINFINYDFKRFSNANNQGIHVISENISKMIKCNEMEEHRRMIILKIIPKSYSWFSKYCAENGNLELLKWSYKNKYPLQVNIDVSGALGGNLKILKWLKDIGIKFGGNTIYNAARSGNLEMIKWLLDQGCVLNENVFHAAITNGHFEISEWLRQQNCPYDMRTCSGCAWKRNLEALQWLRKYNYPWNVEIFIEICIDAAFFKHWEVLKWAVENGCPYKYDILPDSFIKTMKESGNIEMINWIEEYENKLS